MGFNEGKSGGMLGHVTARCAGCGRVISRSRFERPKGRNRAGKLDLQFCPPGEGCKKDEKPEAGGAGGGGAS